MGRLRTRGRDGALVAMAFALAFALAVPAAAIAHVPALEPSGWAGPVVIEGPDVSRALYGFLADGNPVDEYRFSVGSAVTATIGVIVPAYSEHADFRPGLVISASGEPTTVITDPGLSPRVTEWEPFSLTTFWRGGQTSVTFRTGVEYTLRVVADGASRGGRYVLVFGGDERFTAADTAATMTELPVIWFGAYGGAPLHWNWWAVLIVGVPAGAVIALAAALLRRLRKRGARRIADAP